MKRYLVSIFVLSKKFSISETALMAGFLKGNIHVLLTKRCIFQILIQSKSSFPSYVTFFVEHPLMHRSLKNTREEEEVSNFFKKRQQMLLVLHQTARKCAASCRSSSGELLQKAAEARLLKGHFST